MALMVGAEVMGRRKTIHSRLLRRSGKVDRFQLDLENSQHARENLSSANT